jgi:acetylglutamate kinase
LETAIQKADVLIEALGWIRRFRDKVTVVKLGGSLIENGPALRHILVDLIFMEAVGMHPVVVHGGGSAISRAMDAAGIVPRFVQGRRVTDEATLKIVKNVLAGDTNRDLVNQINQMGGSAESLSFSTRNVLFGEKISLADPEGKPIDLGRVGRVTRVDANTIRDVFSRGAIPVIPSMCIELGTNDQALNVNADTSATAVAQQLAAEKLVYLSDVNGVRMHKNDPDSRIQSLTASEARRLISTGVIDSGMIPKVEACLETLTAGVQKVHIIDGSMRHALLLEIFTTTGVGTEIVHDRA